MNALNDASRAALALLLLLCIAPSAPGQQYVLVGWNDLGMHCSNKDFSKIAVLPPFNNVTAQLIEVDSVGLPRLVTSGFRVEYSIPGNTTSAGKTDFWTYAQQLFGLVAVHSSTLGRRYSRIFSRPMRSLLFTVPNGTPVSSAISTCVMPAKYAISITRRWSSGTCATASRTACASSAISASWAGVASGATKASGLSGSARSGRPLRLRTASTDLWWTIVSSHDFTWPRSGSRSTPSTTGCSSGCRVSSGTR